MKGMTNLHRLFLLLTILTLFSSELASTRTAISSSSAEIMVFPTYLAVKIGANFTISVVLINCVPFNLFNVTIRYNTSKMDALDASITVPWSECWAVVDDGVGAICFGAMNLTHSLQGNLTLAMAEFNATARGNSTLQLSDTVIMDAQQEPITHTTHEGLLEILGPLHLAGATARGFYYPEQNVTTCGNTTLDGTVADCLIGIEVRDPSNAPIVMRTTTSGYIPANPSCKADITSFYSSDQYANPISNFRTGEQSYFTINVTNLSDQTLPILITINAYDRYNGPIGLAVAGPIPILPTLTTTLISPIYIRTATYNGTATAYASVFSNWPHDGGIPYCLEESTSFQITEGLTGIPPKTPLANQTFTSDYNMTFRFPTSYVRGNYSVCISAVYKVQEAYAQTAFLATFLGDGNGDGRVSSYDLARLIVAYGSTQGSPKWNPSFDFDNNGEIGPYDLAILISNFGKHI